MNEPKSPLSLEELSARLAKARAERPGRKGAAAAERPRLSGLGFAFRVGVDLVAGVMVGVGIGWLLDRWLGTGPWLLIVFFLLGSAAGMLNVYRTVSGLGRSPGGAGGAGGAGGGDEAKRGG